MAHRMAIRGFQNDDLLRVSTRLNHIWNISHGVGTPGRERNHPHDVELVQRLILLNRPSADTPLVEIPSDIWESLKPTGHLDSATIAAIKLKAVDGELRHHGGWRISPARHGTSEYDRGAANGAWPFFIAYLNNGAARTRLDGWLQLPATCSTGLRRSLEAHR